MKPFVLALLFTSIGISYVNGQAPAPQQLAAKPQLGPNQWAVDASHSAAHFSVRHMMVTTVRGQLGPITGTVEYDGKDVRTTRADVKVDVAGINTQKPRSANLARFAST
jgi:polyisoprenoid-binding protein YceI